MARDWQAWAARATAALDMGSGATAEGFCALFAPGGTYEDPVTAATDDPAAVFAVTRATMADWRMEVTSAAGDESAGVMEWVGRGTLASGAAVALRGCTVVRLDPTGRVLRWRDYFDMGEFGRQASTS